MMVTIDVSKMSEKVLLIVMGQSHRIQLLHVNTEVSRYKLTNKVNYYNNKQERCQK